MLSLHIRLAIAMVLSLLPLLLIVHRLRDIRRQQYPPLSPGAPQIIRRLWHFGPWLEILWAAAFFGIIWSRFI